MTSKSDSLIRLSDPPKGTCGQVASCAMHAVRLSLRCSCMHGLFVRTLPQCAEGRETDLDEHILADGKAHVSL